MKYVNDCQKLQRIARIVTSKEVETKQYYLSHLQPRLAKVEDTKDRLTKLFVIANKERRSVTPENLEKAATQFYQGIDRKIEECKTVGPQQAHEKFLQWLCDIDWMEQKTANLFLKWLAMFQKDLKLNLLDWQSWRPYLHVPLDTWVVRLIGKDYLDVCTEAYEQDFFREGKHRIPSSKATRYEDLQNELAQILSLIKEPRIVLDTLWFVGKMYCDYRPFLCGTCWLLTEECRSRKSPELDKPSMSKRERKELERRANKKLIEKYPEEYEGYLKLYSENKKPS
jgi:hypothetical protein